MSFEACKHMLEVVSRRDPCRTRIAPLGYGCTMPDKLITISLRTSCRPQPRGGLMTPVAD